MCLTKFYENTFNFNVSEQSFHFSQGKEKEANGPPNFKTLIRCIEFDVCEDSKQGVQMEEREGKLIASPENNLKHELMLSLSSDLGM